MGRKRRALLGLVRTHVISWAVGMSSAAPSMKVMSGRLVVSNSTASDPLSAVSRGNPETSQHPRHKTPCERIAVHEKRDNVFEVKPRLSHETPYLPVVLEILADNDL